MKKGGVVMKKTVRIRVNSNACVSSTGNIRIRTTVNNGRTSKTITKTIRPK